MDLKVRESKTTRNGRTLLLAEDHSGRKLLLEEVELSVSPKELDLIQKLRQMIKNAGKTKNDNDKLLVYIGIERLKDQFYLVLPFHQGLWDHWDLRDERVFSPHELVAAGKVMIEALNILKEESDMPKGFFFTDLVPLGPSDWGVLDPRIKALLAPYRPEDELRKYFLPPEIIKGSDWGMAANLYTIGLTMYYLGTGVFPFPLEREEETITAVIREKPVDPRFHQPAIGGKLAETITALLEKEPGRRPGSEEVLQKLEKLTGSGESLAGPEEAARFRQESEAVIRRAERKRKIFWWWQRLKWPVAIIAIFIIFFVFTGRSGYQEVITNETKPRQVVDFFYQGLAELNISQLEETLGKGVGNEFRHIVTNLHVISKMRMAYEGKTIPFLVVEGLKVAETPESTAERPAFTGEYIIKIAEGLEYVVQQRRDLLFLGKVKGEWRIIFIDSRVLSEGREALPDPVLPGSLEKAGGEE